MSCIFAGISKKLLEENRMTICEVAQEVRYKNYSSFIRAFKRVTNLTPREYQKKFKKGT